MATNSEEGSLNDFFKRMAEDSEESKKWKDYTKGYIAFEIGILSDYLRNTSEQQVTVRQYGSSAEGLKCYLPQDIGDVDVMIFPLNEELEITEGMLVNIVDRPGFVRIRGDSHPVLNRCLFDGSEFVATATLKKMHPEIFGEMSTFAGRAKKVLVAASRRENTSDVEFTQKIANSADGPAITMEFAQSFDSLTKQEETLRDPTCYQNNSAAFEAFAAWICESRGVHYTRQHADLFNSYMEYAKDQVHRLAMDGSSLFTGFPRLVNELAFGPRVCELVQLREQMESSLAVTENESAETGSVLERRMSSGNGETANAATNLSLPLSEERGIRGTDRRNEIQYAENKTRESDLGPEPEVQEPEVLEPEILEHGHNGKKESETEGGKGELSSEVSASEAAPRERATSLPFNTIFDHLLDVRDADVRDESSWNTEAAAEHDRIGGADFIPAFQGQGWPQVAQEWCWRQRQWPSSEVIEKITRESFHIVVKTSKMGGNPDLDFRLSFSHAEFLLSQEMNVVQKECYRCLKLFHRAFLRTDEKVLVSYHLKTVLLWSAEETGLEFWREENRSCCVLTLLGKLYEALSRKVLPHFFISNCNLFEHAASEYPDLLESLAGKVKDLQQNPTCFEWNLVLQEPAPSAEVAHSNPREMNSRVSDVESITPEFEQDPTAAAVAAVRSVPSEITSPADGTIKSEPASAAALPVPSEQPLRYHDFQDLYVDAAGEIAALALSGADVPTNDSVLSELVTEMRAVSEKHPELTVEDFVTMFKSTTSMAYATFQLASGTDFRQRILGELNGKMKIFKYCTDQDDFSPGNEEAIARRLLDPSGGFDLNHIFPAGCGLDLISGVLNFLEPAVQTATNIEPDDIPLD